MVIEKFIALKHSKKKAQETSRLCHELTKLGVVYWKVDGKVLPEKSL